MLELILRDAPNPQRGPGVQGCSARTRISATFQCFSSRRQQQLAFFSSTPFFRTPIFPFSRYVAPGSRRNAYQSFHFLQESFRKVGIHKAPMMLLAGLVGLLALHASTFRNRSGFDRLHAIVFFACQSPYRRPARRVLVPSYFVCTLGGSYYCFLGGSGGTSRSRAPTTGQAGSATTRRPNHRRIDCCGHGKRQAGAGRKCRLVGSRRIEP